MFTSIMLWTKENTLQPVQYLGDAAFKNSNALWYPPLTMSVLQSHRAEYHF